MNIPKRIRTFVTVGFFAVIGCATVMIWFHQLQPRTVEAQSQSETKLTLEVSISQNKYVKLEPIDLNFKLLNQTTVPVTWNKLLMLGSGIDFLVRGKNGNDVRWNSEDYYGGFPVIRPEITQPGKDEQIQYLIDEKFAELMFPQAGHYRVRIEFNYDDFSSGERERKTISSNLIAIEIAEPQGRDRIAYDYIRTMLEPARQLVDRKEEMRIREYFVNHFSDSVYWKYKTFELANIYLSLGQYQNAENEFYNISDVDFYHSKRVTQELDQLAKKIGRPYRRTKRPPDLTNMPIGRPILSPNISAIPMPTIPAPIRVPHPTP